MRDPPRRAAAAPRARRRVRRRRVPAPHEPRAGSAPAHARDRREHGASRRATGSGERSTASRSCAATGSPPATSTRRSCGPSSTRTLGVEWEQPRKGMAELRHVPREVIREFSTRRAQVVEQLARQRRRRLLRGAGRGGRDARAQGARRPRRAARGLARPRRRARPRQPRAAGAARARPLRASPPATSCFGSPGAMLGPHGLTEKQTAFSDPDVVMAWAAGAHVGRVGRARAPARGTAHPDRRRRARRRGSEPGPPGPLLDRRARRRRAGRARACRARPRRRSAVDQRAASRRDRACRPDRPLRRAGGDGARGRDRARAASSASSASPAPARRPPPTPSPRSFAQAGIDVLGAAPSGVAAEKLQDETGIPATTLHRLLDACAPRRRPAAPAACSSSTRPGWPRRASSRPCSSWSSRRTGRRS